jgi:hypothetical protein
MTAANYPDPPAQGPPIALALLAAIALMLVALAVFVPDIASLFPRSPDQEAVAAVVQRVMVANQTVGIPPQRDPDGHVSVETVDAMHAQVRDVAAQLLIGPYRQQWIDERDDLIDIEVSSEFIFEGGAHDFSRWQITIEGDRATVQVRCRIFLVMAQTFAGHRSRAENTIDAELTLERVDGAWLVSGQMHRFSPGGGP